MSCVWQLPNKRIYDDDDVLVCLIVKWVGWVSPCVGMTGWVGQSLPLYLSELISHYLPPRSLRSSNTNLLTRPAGITSNFSSRAFSVSAPSTWNSLPAHIRSIDTLSTFKRHQKFHLYQSALPSSHPVLKLKKTHAHHDAGYMTWQNWKVQVLNFQEELCNKSANNHVVGAHTLPISIVVT